MKKIILLILLTTNVYAQDTCAVVVKANKHTVLEQIIFHDIKFPDIALAQARFESGNFKSYIFKQNNNMFGMRLPKARKTTAIAKHKNYAVYDSWISSIQDYKLWQDNVPQKYKINKNIYLSYLQRIYATNSNYISMLKKFK